MKRAIPIAATTGALFAAAAVAAAERTILILPDTYFPSITYLNEGDTVRFVNVSGAEHTRVSKHGKWDRSRTRVKSP